MIYCSAAISCVAIAMLAGCGGSQPPVGSPGAMAQTSAIATHADHGTSWMLPEAKAKDLLYVSSVSSGNIYVYSYPQGRLVGTLSTGNKYAAGECVDSSGDVFVATAASDESTLSTIYVYAHGGATPIASLAFPYFALACAVDPTTGNLAVAGDKEGYGIGTLGIYQNASGNPAMYYSSGYDLFSCGYDVQGNLYLAGWNGFYGNQAQLLRLASGSGSFDLINVSATIYFSFEFRPSVQWDGRYMTVSSDRDAPDTAADVFRLRISGSDASVVRTTVLSNPNAGHEGLTWIQGNRIFGIDRPEKGRRDPGYKGISVWPYPEGSKALQNIPHIGNERDGEFGAVVLSQTL